MDFSKTWEASEIDFFMDASKVYGLGGISENQWMYTPWNQSFIKEKNLSIKYLELFAVVTAVISWISKYRNKRIILFCDNQAVVEMINSTTSSCKNCMVLFRVLVLQGLIQNVKIFARHVSGILNKFADRLSRGELEKFFQLAENEKHTFNEENTIVSSLIWPPEKLDR